MTKTILYSLDGEPRWVGDYKGDAPRRMGKAVEDALKHKHSLKGLDLVGVDFRGRDIQGAVFDGSDMAGCDLEGCKINATWFECCNLEGANITNVNARHASFLGSDFENADIQGDFTHAQLDLSTLTKDQTDKMKLSFQQVEDLNILNRKIRFLE